MACAVALILAAAGRADDRTVVTGVRATWGDAVDCPRIRADDGRLHPVSYLPPSVPIGGRVTARGVPGITVGCTGTVLVIDSIEIIE